MLYHSAESTLLYSDAHICMIIMSFCIYYLPVYIRYIALANGRMLSMQSSPLIHLEGHG